jgi:hypothetical protein
MGPEILLGLKRQHCTPLYRQVVTFSRLRGRQRGRTNEAGLEECPTLPSRCKIRFQNSCYDLFRLRPVNEAILEERIGVSNVSTPTVGDQPRDSSLYSTDGARGSGAGGRAIYRADLTDSLDQSPIVILFPDT